MWQGSSSTYRYISITKCVLILIRILLIDIFINLDQVLLPGSGSGFQISLDPDPFSAQILEQKKGAERSPKVIYQKKTYKL